MRADPSRYRCRFPVFVAAMPPTLYVAPRLDSVHLKNPRPAFAPISRIHHVSPTLSNSTTSPFENRAAARRPLKKISRTLASLNDLRNSEVGGVQFLIFRPPTRSQAIRSQRG